MSQEPRGAQSLDNSLNSFAAAADLQHEHEHEHENEDKGKDEDEDEEEDGAESESSEGTGSEGRAPVLSALDTTFAKRAGAMLSLSLPPGGRGRAGKEGENAATRGVDRWPHLAHSGTHTRSSAAAVHSLSSS